MREEIDGGVWVLDNHILYLYIPKLLARLGLPDTEENRDLAVKVTRETAARSEQLAILPKQKNSYQGGEEEGSDE